MLNEITALTWQAELARLPEDDVTKIKPELRETILGNKPACYIPITGINSKSVQYLQELGFECIPTKNAIGSVEDKHASLFAIARETKATEYFTQEIKAFFQKKFPGLSDRLDVMFKLADQNTTATLLSILSCYPRVDDQYEVEKYYLERPEVALVTGILLGYPQKDVDYYIRTRYMGEAWSENPPIPENEYRYVRDPNQD